MKTKQASFLEVLGAPGSQYVIPVYQRVYSWTERYCEVLWEDVVQASKKGHPHFVGTMLYRPEGEHGGVCRLALVDGQQRLATLVLLLTTLRDHLEGQDAEGAADIAARFLWVATDEGESPKVVLSRSDHDTLNAIVSRTEVPEGEKASELILENYEFFHNKMNETDFSAESIMRGLEQFVVMIVELEDADKPQLVFESLNAKGVHLKTADLIRNLLFTQLGYKEQVRLFEQYWEPLEDLFDDIEDKATAERKGNLTIAPRDRRVAWEGVGLDAALHAWLVDNAPEIVPRTRSDLYGAFKAYISETPDLSLENLLESINASCTDFANRFDSPEVKLHLDWAIGKPEGFGGRQ